MKIQPKKLWPVAAGIAVALLVTFVDMGIHPDIRGTVAAVAGFGGIVVSLIWHGLTPGA